jgi:HEAT repeat protein
LALGKLGPGAVAAGGALLRAVQTEDTSVREQAMRSIAMIRPPEILEAFSLGLRDANGEIRKVASGGWIRAESIPEAVVPLLIEALRDPETPVRANAARVLARLDSLPSDAIAPLVACTADANDALRMYAAIALKTARVAAALEAMEHLLEDANVRIALIAAGSRLCADPDNARARAVVTEALSDSAPRTRRAALELVDALGAGGASFREALQQRIGVETEPDLREVLARLPECLTPEGGATPPTGSENPVPVPGPSPSP